MQADPGAARELVRETLTETRGSIARAAHLLNTNRRNLLRWVHSLDLWEHVWEERRKAGNARWAPATR